MSLRNTKNKVGKQYRICEINNSHQWSLDMFDSTIKTCLKCGIKKRVEKSLLEQSQNFEFPKEMTKYPILK